MARLIFLVNDLTILLLENPLDSGELIRLLNAGERVKMTVSPLLNQGSTQVPRVLEIVARQEEKSTRRDLRHLSLRQRQILLLLAEGLDTRQVAARLGITPRAVAYHIEAVKKCLGTSSRAESIHRATTLGLLAAPSKP